MKKSLCIYTLCLSISGLVPITLGRKAVDPVTGVLSPTVGVRLSPDTNTVIPVTQSTGKHKKRKPALGAVSMLEDEIAARRGFWRRQREREIDLTLEEFALAQSILFNVDSVVMKRADETLENMLEKAHGLNDAAKRETQRRSDAEQEYTSVLPPDVVAILTDGDEAERKAEEAHYGSHKRYVEVIRKFFQKLQDEETRFKDRLSELEGAMNPDAENTVRQRYQQAKSRLHAELKDQILNKMESLDDDHSTLEYIRQRNELLTLEAKGVLTGELFIAGDYDCMLGGIYGETDLTSTSSNHELVPLLKKLIEMLQSGKPFVLSPELMNMIQGGDTYNIQGGDINMQGYGAGAGHQQGVVTEHLQQKSASGVDESIDSSALVDLKKLQSSGPMDDNQLKELKRDLVTKQTFEAAKLESGLRNNEMMDISHIITDYEGRKQGVVNDVSRDLKKRLRNAPSQEDQDRILLEYATKIQVLNDALEKQKQKELEQLRKKLLDHRRQKRKDLHHSHIMEAKRLGLSPDIVPAITIPSHDKMDRELRLLAQQQEKMLAEMRRVRAEQDDKERPEYEKDIEKRIRKMGLGDEKETELINKVRSLTQKSRAHEGDIKGKMKSRKARNNPRSVRGIENLNEGEKAEAVSTQNMLTKADRLTEENSLIDALRKVDEVRIPVWYMYHQFWKCN